MKFAAASGLAVALLAPAAAVLSAAAGREVLVVTPHHPEMVEMNRALWTRGEAVPEIYGIPHGRMRILFPDRAKLVVPPEDPSMTLLLKGPGDAPLQTKTVWYVATRAAAAGFLAALVGLLARGLRRTCRSRVRPYEGAHADVASRPVAHDRVGLDRSTP
ncbi:MAG: hypothetical protein HYY17_08730 [Planctomycetes bacterium]|nr:hypothetical protein [Planctomycetota bacterium]